MTETSTNVARPFWAQAHVDGERVAVDTGETVLSASELLAHVVREVGDVKHGQIEILVRRAP
jgi:hypothetical protein